MIDDEAMMQRALVLAKQAQTVGKEGAVARCAQFSKMQGLNHPIVCEGGVLAEEASNLLRNFFRKKR